MKTLSIKKMRIKQGVIKQGVIKKRLKSMAVIGFTLFPLVSQAGTLFNFQQDNQKMQVLINENSISGYSSAFDFSKQEVTIKDDAQKTYTLVKPDEMIESIQQMGALFDKLKMFMPPEQLEAMGLKNPETLDYESKFIGMQRVNGYQCSEYQLTSKAGTSKVCIASFKVFDLSDGIQHNLSQLANKFTQAMSSMPSILPVPEGLDLMAKGIPVYGSFEDGSRFELKSHTESTQASLLSIPSNYTQQKMPSFDEAMGEGMGQGMGELMQGLGL